MKYEITEEQIKKNKHLTLEQYFKEVFDVKLEVGRWYKWKNGAICCHTEDKEDYGINSFGECIPNNHWLTNGCNDGFTPATDSEVLEALKNEAIKRGFKKKTWFLNGDNSKQICDGEIELHLGANNSFLGLKFGFYNGLIMDKFGTWATIIPTYTKKEAEKLLNAKII